MSSPTPAPSAVRTSNPERTFALLQGMHRSETAETTFEPETSRTVVSKTLRLVADEDHLDTDPDVRSPDPTVETDAPAASELAPPDSIQQTSQLAALLAKREQELTERDVDFQVKIWNWQQETKKIESRLAKRARQLEERETQLMALQFELFQLQHQLIDSQLATRELVEDLSLGTANPHTIATLKSLKFELGKRFDHVHHQWTDLVNRLESIAADIAVKVATHERAG